MPVPEVIQQLKVAFNVRASRNKAVARAEKVLQDARHELADANRCVATLQERIRSQVPKGVYRLYKGVVLINDDHGVRINNVQDIANAELAGTNAGPPDSEY